MKEEITPETYKKINEELKKREGRETTSTYNPMYNRWNTMVMRCHNPTHKYGALGIKVCDRWRVFTNFYEDMESLPLRMPLLRD